VVIPNQGDIWWVRFGDPEDSGPSGKRPAVVIQNDLLNRSNIRTTVVSLITSNLRLASVPGNIRLQKGDANPPKSSVVVVSQMTTIDKSRLIEKIGTLRKIELEEIIRSCQNTISLIQVVD
jgi:mRNA interferase MazF